MEILILTLERSTLGPGPPAALPSLLAVFTSAPPAVSRPIPPVRVRPATASTVEYEVLSLGGLRAVILPRSHYNNESAQSFWRARLAPPVPPGRRAVVNYVSIVVSRVHRPRFCPGEVQSALTEIKLEPLPGTGLEEGVARVTSAHNGSDRKPRRPGETHTPFSAIGSNPTRKSNRTVHGGFS